MCPEPVSWQGVLASVEIPTEELERCADDCIRYFAATADQGVTFDGSKGGRLVAYSDSDWAVVHSTTGYCLMLAATLH